MEEKIDIQEIVQTFKKRLGLIITVSLVAVVVSAIITFFIITPQYQASTQILVNQSQNENEEGSTTDIESSMGLISTYNVIITSPAILEPAIEKSNFDGSVEALRSKINVTAEEESQVATVTINDEDPQRAVVLANSISETFEQQIPEIMNVDNVSILSKAQLAENEQPISPQPVFNLAISFLIGLLAGIGIAFVLEFLDKSIKNEQDIEKELDLPVLGAIPTMDTEQFSSHSKNSNSRNNARSHTRERDRKTS